MRLIQCENGHFYDAEKYGSCPHCGVAGRKNPQNGGFGQQPGNPQGNGGMGPMGGYQNMAGNSQDSQTVGFHMAPNGSFSQDGGAGGRMSPDQQEVNSNRTVPMMVWRRTSEQDREREEQATRQNVQPVVGWLVCVEGENYGKSFPLNGGRNFIGRSPEMDVCLAGDMTVSSHRHAVLIYEPKQREFFVQPGDTHELFYLNDKVVLESMHLNNRDKLTVGRSTLVFVAFCDETFGWDE